MKTLVKIIAIAAHFGMAICVFDTTLFFVTGQLTETNSRRCILFAAGPKKGEGLYYRPSPDFQRNISPAYVV
jgi:hypothetical protein